MVSDTNIRDSKSDCEPNEPSGATMAFTPSPLVLVSSPSWENDSLTEMHPEINDTFPSDLKFNENSLTVVIVYCVLFVIAAVGNLTVFITLFKSRHRKSRISLMITHLAVADLMVTFIMIPLEVSCFRFYYKIIKYHLQTLNYNKRTNLFLRIKTFTIIDIFKTQVIY